MATAYTFPTGSLTENALFFAQSSQATNADYSNTINRFLVTKTGKSLIITMPTTTISNTTPYTMNPYVKTGNSTTSLGNVLSTASITVAVADIPYLQMQFVSTT